MKAFLKKHHFSIVISFILCSFLAPDLRAQTAASYLKMDVSARAAGMGGAFVSVADDVAATNYNPAGIANLSAPSFSTMTANLGNGQKHSFFNAVYPLSRFQAAAFSWINSRSGEASFINAATGALNTVEDKQDAYVLSYAMKIEEDIKLGANIKFLRQDFGISSAKGTSFDFGLLYSPVLSEAVQKTAFGLTLQDISGSLKDDKTGAKSDVDFVVKLGASSLFFQDKLLAALAFDFGVDSGDKKTLTHFGLEYYPLPETKMLAVRAGYDDKFFTTGVGVNFRGLGVDYSYRNKGDNDESIQRVSVMYQLMKY